MIFLTNIKLPTFQKTNQQNVRPQLGSYVYKNMLILIPTTPAGVALSTPSSHGAKIYSETKMSPQFEMTFIRYS